MQIRPCSQSRRNSLNKPPMDNPNSVQDDRAHDQHAVPPPYSLPPSHSRRYSLNNHHPTPCRTIGHTINTLILLLPTLYYWNDPRWKFVLVAKLTLPEAVWEQASHFFTKQLHNVHKWKILPLLAMHAVFFLNGGPQQVLSGPRDGLYWFMIYYFVVFMGGNLVEVRNGRQSRLSVESLVIQSFHVTVY